MQQFILSVWEMADDEGMFGDDKGNKKIKPKSTVFSFYYLVEN